MLIPIITVFTDVVRLITFQPPRAAGWVEGLEHHSDTTRTAQKDRVFTAAEAASKKSRGARNIDVSVLFRAQKHDLQ